MRARYGPEVCPPDRLFNRAAWHLLVRPQERPFLCCFTTDCLGSDPEITFRFGSTRPSHTIITRVDAI